MRFCVLYVIAALVFCQFNFYRKFHALCFFLIIQIYETFIRGARIIHLEKLEKFDLPEKRPKILFGGGKPLPHTLATGIAKLDDHT